MARPKVAFYGAYPNGFLERARVLLGVSPTDPVLHVCAGQVRAYPGWGFGPNDRTLDMDPTVAPDFCQDAREQFPECPITTYSGRTTSTYVWPALLMDPPYTAEDADHYVMGRTYLPTPEQLVHHAAAVVRDGGRIGILHYVVPRPPASLRLVALIGVVMGFGNRIRAFTVFEKR